MGTFISRRVSTIARPGPRHTRRPTSAGCLKAVLLATAATGILCAAATPAFAEQRDGWALDRHLLWDDLVADRDATDTMVDAPSSACDQVGTLGGLGRALSARCRAQRGWWRDVARDARARESCMRVIVPLRIVLLAYPTSFVGEGCSRDTVGNIPV
jgi:hypothetical protein